MAWGYIAKLTRVYAGLPNFRLKLPSRNWTIFLTITGSWTAAVIYDRREKKRIQRRWAKVVEHLALEPIDVQQLPRRLTVYISAPPADGLLPAREHFNEYVKPILVSAALDWDAVEGRREGDVRAGLAERIRKLRKKKGEASSEPLEEELEDVLEAQRARSGVKEWDGIPGDIVIGRHTWKEYVRGLHEGWLGPLDPPAKPEEPKVEEAVAPVVEAMAPTQEASPTQDAPAVTTTTPGDDASPLITTEPEKPKEQEQPKPEEEKKSKKKKQPPPFNTTADYAHSQVSPNCPQALGPTAILPLPHLLGFLNFPIRMYRFLNRRQVADEAGRQTAAAVLAAYRPFEAPGESLQSAESSQLADVDTKSQWEQQRLLEFEEPEWHKSVRERKDDDGTKERIWTDEMVLDPRIAERMRKFVLEPEAEERAKTISTEKEDAWWKSVWPKREEKKKLWEGLVDDA
jgi:import inner membrane translocase subunit TIM54